MRKPFFIVIILIGALFNFICHSALPQRNHHLFYDEPAKNWLEALPMGNGRLGLMVHGGVAQEHIQFNEETLWTGKPRNYARNGAHKPAP